MLRSNLTLAIAVLIPFFAPSAANASIDFIAVGSLSGSLRDYSIQTTAPLENGIAGNRLGGLGSGLAYAGCNSFIAVPDRGPNAVAYNSKVDDTTSYIPRFQSLTLRLFPRLGAGLPYQLRAIPTATTLLSSSTPLTYGTGAGLGLGNGTPALNAANKTNYFTGRSDNFDPTKPSTNPQNGRLDPEGVRVSNDGKSVFITDEYGPFVYQFDRQTGQRTKVFTLPSKFAIANLNSVGATEISGNKVGRVTNKGMEGLAITPDGKTLIGIMQSPLAQDNGVDGAYTRIVKIDIQTGAVQEYAYQLTNIGTAAKPKYPTVSEIVAINSNEFLVDERDGKGLGDDSTAVVKKLYRINLTGAKEVSAIVGEANLAGKAVSKVLFLDLVAALNAGGIGSNEIPAKLEGVAFGPDVLIKGVVKHTLFVANDNDFVANVTGSLHPTGIDNPNKFFVFAIDRADLPNFVPQYSANQGSCGI
jgi:Esterase-like activity of phytase